MSGSTAKPDFRLSQVERVLEAAVVVSRFAQEERRMALAWVELADQPGLPELYVFKDVGNGVYVLESEGQRRAGGYEPLSAMLLSSVGLNDFVIAPLPEGQELIIQGDPEGVPTLVVDVKSPEPLLAFQACLEVDQCVDLVEELESLDKPPHPTIDALKSGINRGVMSDGEAILVSGSISYGTVIASAPIERMVTITAMLVPSHDAPTLLLALLSVKSPGALSVESALLEQPDGYESSELCSFFEANAESLGDIDLSVTFEKFVVDFGGSPSLLSIVNKMPAPNGVSAYF